MGGGGGGGGAAGKYTAAKPNASLQLDLAVLHARLLAP